MLSLHPTADIVQATQRMEVGAPSDGSAIGGATGGANAMETYGSLEGAGGSYGMNSEEAVNGLIKLREEKRIAEISTAVGDSDGESPPAGGERMTSKLETLKT